MSENELATLQREWRESTTDAIHETATKVDLILAKMAEMKQECASAAQLQAVAARVQGLENDRQKIIGGAFVLNLIGAVILWFATKLWK